MGRESQKIKVGNQKSVHREGYGGSEGSDEIKYEGMGCTDY